MRSNRGALDTIREGLRLSPELKRGLLGTVLIACIATAGRVVVPIAVQQVIDRGLLGGDVDMDFVIRMGLFALAAVVVTGAATAFMHLRLAEISETALSGIRIRAFRHIHNLSMLHQASEQRGVLVARVTSDVDQISRFMQWAGLMLLVNGLQAAIALSVMFTLSWRLALIVALAVPFIALVIRFFQSRLRVAFLTVRERVGLMLALIAETVVGSPVIRAYGTERRTRERLHEAIESHRVSATRAGRLSATFSGVGELMSAVVVAAVIAVGTILAASGITSVGTVVAFLFLVQLFVQPVQFMGEAVNEAQTAVAGWSRVLDILAIAPDVKDPGVAGVDLPSGELGVEFNSVHFRYPRPGQTAAEADTPAVLQDINVDIPARQSVAIVGETGSGKTTFAKLLTRLMDPSSGSVRVGRADLKRVRFDSLRERVVMVPQEGVLFRGTIGDNVRMGRPGASKREIELVFQELGLEGWLTETANGIDTQVGERGDSLSVGERQLVTLARAAIADPDLLVLDEATSSVDPATEARIAVALSQLSRGRTVVTIAHRLSSAETADRVLVFDQGRIVQDGPHHELAAKPGIYRGLFESWRKGTSSQGSSTSTMAPPHP